MLALDSASSNATVIAIVQQALMTLRMQCNAWRTLFPDLEPALGAETLEMSADAILAADNIVDQLALAYARLRTHVVPFDRVVFGDAIDSFRELALRGQMFVVIMCLRWLREAMPSAPETAPSQDPCRRILGDQFERIDDVVTFVELEFQRITSIWAPFRRGSQSPAVCAHRADPERTALYRVAVNTAQREMEALLSIAKLGAFLQAGVASRHWPAVQTACSHIACALQARLNAEPELPYMHASPPLTAPRARVASHPTRS